nr:MAG: patatin-like phospholipase [Diabrotica toursvirus 3a]
MSFNEKDKFGNIFKCNLKHISECTTLIISGGAYKILYFLGALDNISLKRIKYFGGTSIGSVLITLLAIGLTPFQITKEIFSDKFAVRRDLLEIVLENLKTKFKEKNIDENITFSEFTSVHGKQLAFVAGNITTGNQQIFSHKDTPSMSVILAIKMSCSLPIVFPASVYNNNVFVDGLFFNNFPIDLYDTFPIKDDEKVLAISTRHSHYENNFIKKFYKNPDKFIIVLIPESIHKYFLLSKLDKFLMFCRGRNYIKNRLKL